ncbi:MULTISPECIES: phosphorylase family protein [Methylomonas]|uniref:phosphorylase family protein n=1 Tax=Methylomonas TaxID=416 RepID=UPI001E44B53C|nr:phosphorylase [Methylomonas rhizoryzae]
MNVAEQTAPSLLNFSTGLNGIVVALPEELATLTGRKLKPGNVQRDGNSLLALSGAGPKNAEQATQALIAHGATRLISWGCAAGLSDTLKPGDLVIPESIVTPQQALAPNPALRSAAIAQLTGACKVISDDLYSGGDLVTQSSQKRSIHQSYGATALDMESAAVGRAAQAAGLPFLAIRSIADPAHMDLPPAVCTALNSQGQVELSRLLSALLKNPRQIPALIRLGLFFRAAQKTLSAAARLLHLP